MDLIYYVMSLGEKIKAIRARLLLTQRDLAKELGTTQMTIVSWETGKSMPKIQSLKKLRDFCRKHGIDSLI